MVGCECEIPGIQTRAMLKLLQVKEKVLREGEFLGIIKLGKEMLTSKEAK